MKTCILFFGLMWTCISCSTIDDNNDFIRNVNDSIHTYSDSKGTTLTLTSTTWIATTQSGFGTVQLVVSGSTNADRVTVRSYGDGLISDENIKLDSNKRFTNDTMAISFTHAPSNELFEMKTVIKSYKGLDTINLTVNSGKLKY